VIALRTSIRTLFGLCLLVASLAALRPTPTAAFTLPDNRAYELVSHIGEAGGESVLNGGAPAFAGAAENGEAVAWQALASCCGALSGGLNAYVSQRGSSGWETTAVTPASTVPALGLEILGQEAMAWNGNLSSFLFSTSSSYAPGDERAPGSGAYDLYLRQASGALKWVSQGPAGSGKGTYGASFEGATSDLGAIAFTSAEPLTDNAVGLRSDPIEQYLYVRNVEAETTTLIDVDNAGNLIGPYGASLGNAGFQSAEALYSFSQKGDTTHAISEDGSKVFFETPAEGTEALPEGIAPHLYMRDLADATTTPIDDPAAAGWAHYEGAAADGALVFFTSDEGLDGASSEDELYAFNTTTQQIGPIPPMGSVPLGGGNGMLGVTAIANDGSRVYFVAEAVLAPNVNSAGDAAAAGEPNLYVYDTSTGETAFIAMLARPDVNRCLPACANGEAAGLVREPDVGRTDYTSADGSQLVFLSSGDLTGEAHAPDTTLKYGAFQGEEVLHVESTAGFYAGHWIAIGSGGEEEEGLIKKVDGPTEMTLDESTLSESYEAGAAVTEVNSEVYRFDSAGATLSCLSCTPPGTLSTASASLGEGATGGSYAPRGTPPQMSEDGSQIFFESPDPLAAGAGEAITDRVFEPMNLYEWENGHVYLVADAADGGASFEGTTRSGGDVFFTTRGQLVPGALAGYEHIYDARVNGGFPVSPPAPAEPCAQEVCLQLPALTPFAPTPASASLGEEAIESAPHVTGKPPSTFVVSAITSAQRRELARSGRLDLAVTATAPGRLLATVTTSLNGRRIRLAQARAMLRGAGSVGLQLRLSTVARSALVRKGKLRLRIEVLYRTTGKIDVAKLTIDAPPRKVLRADGVHHA
jgi:hypothetical protein